MALVLCLNELSCEASAHEAEVNRTMELFIATLRAIRHRRPGSSLVTPVPLAGISLAEEYPIARWAADNRHRDGWRLIRSMQNRAPYTFSELPENEDLGVEHLYQGRPALGLGLAHSLDTLAVSLPAETNWLREWIAVLRRTLAEESDPAIEEEPLDVRHASTADHAAVHGEWLAQAGLTTIATGRQLWVECRDFFPNLSFLPRVADDLARLDPRWLGPVKRRLSELQHALSGWDPSQSPFPTWHDVSPEHVQRQHLCRYPDLDGVVRTFDLHARFTPGPGRLHLRLIREDAAARIAYIGRKLGA